MNNTLTDLKRLLDSGETLTDGCRTMWKAPFPNQYTINHNLSTVTFDWDDAEIYTINPSLWRQRDQIGAEKQPEQIAFEEFKKMPDDGLFPNHSDKDIWVTGFKAGYEYAMKNRF